MNTKSSERNENSGTWPGTAGTGCECRRHKSDSRTILYLVGHSKNHRLCFDNREELLKYLYKEGM
jgi:hypothetical protein